MHLLRRFDVSRRKSELPVETLTSGDLLDYLVI